VDLLQTLEVDCVLMDMQMPVMDGLEATRRLRAQERLQRLPIIAMTANASTQDRRACMAAGMNDFVSKPVEPNRLLDIVARWAGREEAEARPAGPGATATAALSGTLPAGQPAAGLSAPTAAPRDAPAPARPSQVADQEVLDPQVLRSLTRGNASAMRPIVKVFETMMDKTVVELQQALAARDTVRLGQLGHKAKSSAAALGAQGLSRHCHALETAMRAAEPDMTLAAELVQEIQRLSPLVVQALKTLQAQAQDTAPRP
jgi:CheY-like chemotaxis protein